MSNQLDARPALANTEAVGETVKVAATQSGLAFVAKLGAFGVGFAFNVLLARMFGASAIGEYSIMQSIITIAAVASVFGLDFFLLKYVPRVRQEEGDGVATYMARRVVRVSALWSVVVAVVLWLVSEPVAVHVFDDRNLTGVLQVAAVGLVPFSLIKVLGGYLKGIRQSAYFTLLSEFADRVFLIAIVFTFALFGLNTGVYLAVGWLATKAIVLALVAIRARRSWGAQPAPGEPLWELRPEARKYLVTMVAIAVVAFLQTRADMIIIGIFLDVSSVGIYKIALVVSSLVTFSMAATLVIFPTIISEYLTAGREDELESMYVAITRWVGTISLPVVISMVAFPEEILAFFGPEYVAGASALVVLGLGNFVNAIVGANGFLLTMSGRERIVLINNILAGCIGIAASVLLIPRFGLLGSAIAISSAVTFISLIKVVQVKWLMGMLPYDRSIVSLVVAGVIMLGLTYLAHAFVGNVWGVVAITSTNLVVGFVVTYLFQNDLDRVLFSLVAARFSRKP